MVNGRFKVNIVQSIINFQKRECTYPQNALKKILGGGGRGGTVVKVLCYKSEGRWLDHCWCPWNFSLT